MTKRFEKTAGVLINSFFKETLAKGTCNACAIGNTVAAANGIKILELDPKRGARLSVPPMLELELLASGTRKDGVNAAWSKIFLTMGDNNGDTKQVRMITDDEIDARLEEIIKVGKEHHDQSINNAYALYGDKEFRRLTRMRLQDERRTALRLIQPTGYTAEELTKVESAFEGATKIWFEDYPKHSPEEIKNDQFNGLVAVIDVLAKLDNIDIAVADEYKDALKFQLPIFAPTNPELVEELTA